jgi:hypothetical protein
MRQATSFDVVQVRLASLHPDVFLERNPVVIEDRIADPMELLSATFRSMYVLARGPRAITAGAADARTTARYVILHNNSQRDRVQIKVKHPTPNMQPIIVVLGPKQTLVLPPLWTYSRVGGRLGDDDVVEVALYDFVFGIYTVLILILGFFVPDGARTQFDRNTV